MIRTLDRITLKTGDRLRVAALVPPDRTYGPAIRRFLDHKGQPWLTHIDRANRGEVDALQTTYFIGLLRRRIVGNVMIVGDGRAGILGHVFTHPDYRRQGVCMRLMAAAVDAFHRSDALVLTLGTGYDSPPYHIYASFGFRGVEPGNGHMVLESQPGALDQYFAAAAVRVAEVRWEHWAGLSLLFMSPAVDALRSYAYGIHGPVGFEGGFLRFQVDRERFDARARVLVTKDGSVVGAALCQRDDRWPEAVYALDLVAHSDFHQHLDRLLDALPLPGGVKIQAHMDKPSPARAAALRAAGFRHEATLAGQLVRFGRARDVRVYALRT
ncbi:MAG: GNAT family N-acetyltransferase [Planctomycetota bacterium]